MEPDLKVTTNARIAAFLYLSMLPFAIFSLYVRFSIFDHHSAEQTFANVAQNAMLMRLGILTWLIQQTLSIFLVLYLYRLFRPFHKPAAFTMVVLVATGVAVAFANELNQLAPLLLQANSTKFVMISTELQVAATTFFLHLHEAGVVIVHIFWGLWLFPLGYLAIRSGFVPRFIGVLLILAGVGYLIDFGTFLMLPGRGTTLTQITFVGELLFPLWLLWKAKHLKLPTAQFKV